MKTTIALLLAGGRAAGFYSEGHPLPKALLPVCGRPVADHVLGALEQSTAERVFVVNDAGVDLRAALAPAAKAVFLDKPARHASFGASILYGLERVADFYGPEELRSRTVMIVPCDTPLASPESYDRLMSQAGSRDTDVLFTIISRRRLQERFPRRRFRSIFLADLGERFTLQNVTFVSGSLIRLRDSAGESGLRVWFGSAHARSVDALRRTLEDARSLRDRWYQVPHLVYEVLLRRLAQSGRVGDSCRLVLGLCIGRTSMRQALPCLCAALQIRADFIRSEEVELSGDIDRPEDLADVPAVAEAAMRESTDSLAHGGPQARSRRCEAQG